jgi:hypothetical protein
MNTKFAGVLYLGVILVICGTKPPEVMAQPTAFVGSPKEETQRMKAGRWEGEYIDIDGHRGRLRLTVAKTGTKISGKFELSLATEDEPERYQGTLSGRIDGKQLVLKLHMARGEPMVCTLMLRHPVAFAEQAIFGVVEPVPALKFSGGTLVAWRFRDD